MPEHSAALEAHRLGQHQPALDPTLVTRAAVMFLDAFAPGAPQIRVFHPRQQRRVFQWNARLIVEAVQDPSLDLAVIELAAMQQTVKGVQAVIALIADAADTGKEFLARPRSIGHNAISMPSCATSQPFAEASARSQNRRAAAVGIVDVHEDLAFDAEPANAAIVPSSPATLICPMRRPLFVPSLPESSRRLAKACRRKNEVRILQAIRQLRRHTSATGNEIETPAPPSNKRNPIVSSPDGPYRAAFPALRDRAAPSRNRKPSTVTPSDLRRGYRVRRLIQWQPTALHQIRSQHLENGISGKDFEHAGCGIKGKRLAFPQTEQAGDGIDIAIGKDYRADWAVTQPHLGMQLRAASICRRRSGDALSSIQRSRPPIRQEKPDWPDVLQDRWREPGGTPRYSSSTAEATARRGAENADAQLTEAARQNICRAPVLP
jgi:hypothetical protein